MPYYSLCILYRLIAGTQEIPISVSPIKVDPNEKLIKNTDTNGFIKIVSVVV